MSVTPSSKPPSAAAPSLPNDRELLDRYLAGSSETAFAELVRRHISLVYGIALRRLHDHHLAEDVAQIVFLILARKAKSLRNEVVLGAWLVTTTHLESAAAARRRRRQQKRENDAMQQLPPHHAPLPTEEDDALRHQLIDEALARLTINVRRAVVLRYLNGLSNQDAAAVLGITENSCKQRVCRGLERMRTVLEAKGVSTSTFALGAALPALLAGEPAAVHLVPKIAATAHAAAVAGLSKGALLAMATTKTKIAVAAVVGVLFVGGATAVVVHSRTQTLDLQTPPVAATPVVAPQVSPPPPHAGTAPQQVAGSKVETRQVKTADGKAVSVRGAVVTSGGPEVSYQTMGHVDPEVNAKAQAAAGERLRENVKQLLTVKSIAQRLQITDHQIGQLRIALAASPASGQTANAAFVARIHGILAPEQVKAVFDLPTAGKNDGAQP